MTLIRFLLFVPLFLAAQEIDLKTDYLKYEYEIPMRDGKRLHTAVYVPKDSTQRYPIMLSRTPYTVAPYGSDYLKANGNNYWMAQEKYIMAFQDVRGRFMSEGEYEDVRAHIPVKKSVNDVDESSDTYDTIDWLVKNVKGNNGNVGMIGISYPGFYAAHGLIDAHPALKAVSPQAPIADWYIGDDFHHNGVMMLIDAFNFYRSFGKPRPTLTTTWPPGFQYPTEDGYQFLLRAGSDASIKRDYYGDTAKFWNDVFAHPDYDAFWKARSVPQYMRNVKPAVLLVGGFFDAEDLYGPLAIYHAIEKNDQPNRTSLMMGPWFHGGWVRSDGSHLGNVSFGGKNSEYYDQQVRRFFNFYLKGTGEVTLPEVSVFESGSNEWRSYTEWPPKNAVRSKIYFAGKEKLSFDAPKEKTGSDSYISDPNRPVPYIPDITNGRGREYMTADQRFAWQRPDVMSYEMPIENDLTLAGPVTANLVVTTTGTDADFVVKLIDVYPDSAKNGPETSPGVQMSGYQMLVRGDIFRARYRSGFSTPTAMTPNRPETVRFTLTDVNHTFKSGHRLMVQVQSSWFPLADRNPQQFINVYTAKDSDFRTATHTILRNAQNSSYLEVGILSR